jgi:8-amino-7-oxononanoate synthase
METRCAVLLEDRCRPFASLIRDAKELGFYPYYRPISRSWGPEVEVGGRRLVMIGSNDYLGLSHHPRVLEKAAESMKRWGSGPGGSRLLCGNITLHEILEERLAAFVGKKKALVHPTGFSTNLGALSCLLSAKDVVLCDRENHASIYEGSRASHARLIPFAHNDFKAAAEKITAASEKHPDACIFLATEGVFSMSGDMVDLPRLVQLKTDCRRFYIYLDDAHGIGVLGRKGAGTADHFGLTTEIDFIMGTFSKALASIGGFIASDYEDVLEYMKHHSSTMIFSAALPACNAAAVLACIEVLEEEPERVDRLHEITRIASRGYRDIGLLIPNSETPILPILIGSEEKAYHFATDLFNHGIFAPPAVYPAVPKGRALIRTAYMSTHENRHVGYVLEVLDKLARKHRIRSADLDIRHTPISEGIAAADASPIN